MNRDPWKRATQAAERALAANRDQIERSAHGIPAGRSYSRHTTDAAGYRVLNAKHPGRCLACSKRIPAGRQVRYWFGHGITCRGCTLIESGT